MATDTRVTAQHILDTIAELIAHGRDEEAIAFWESTEFPLRHRMTDDQFFGVMSLLSSAAMALDLERLSPSDTNR